VSAASKFVPEPEGLVADFYAQLASTGRLHFQRCRKCGAVRHPPRLYCAACGSPDWTLAPSDGLGRVHATALTERDYDPGWADDLPYTVVVVELDQGPRIVTVGRGFTERPCLGQRVKVQVEARGESFAFFWSSPP